MTLRSIRLALLGALLVAVVLPPSALARTDGPMIAAPKPTAAAAYARMTAAQRVGQLFMAGVPSTGASEGAIASLRAVDIGDVILDGNTTKSSKAIGRVSTALVNRLRVAHVQPFVSTDQEGGLVQRLQGHGFSTIPTALRQGAMAPSALKAASATWAHQLAGAGVDLDLAPVADVVPAKHAKKNQPIGQFDREYGHTPKVVASHVDAFIRGMTSAGVETTVKHFPGLGRASGNTDTSPHVTDPTTRHDPYLKSFAAGIATGAPFVMVSSATYPHIDPIEPACFSPTIITSMLREQFGFTGVVISDDLGTVALKAVKVPARATRFFGAGGTMLLDTTSSQLPAMANAVLAKAAAHPAFAKTIKTAVMTDLEAKAAAGLITD